MRLLMAGACLGAFALGYLTGKTKSDMPVQESLPDSGPEDESSSMCPQEVLIALDAIGVKLTLVGPNTINYTAPVGVLTPGIVEVMRHHAGNLVALLQERKGPENGNLDLRLMTIDDTLHGVELYAEPIMGGVTITSKVYRFTTEARVDRVG